MAPQKKTKSKTSAAEAAAVAAAPSTSRAKRTRTSAAEAPLAPQAEEKANNSTQGAGQPAVEAGASQESFVALQQELANLRREMAILRHPPTSALIAPLLPVPVGAAEAIPEPPAPLLRGDPNSPLSVGLETARWP